MRLKSLVVAAVLVLAGCGGDGDTGTGPKPRTAPVTPPPPTTASSSATVDAAANANVFTPQEVTVRVGSVVTWSFGARPHNVAFGSAQGAPADVPTTTNAQVSRTFTTAGTFGYDCTLHPGMTGSVKVQ